MKTCDQLLPRERSIAAYVINPVARVLWSPFHTKAVKDADGVFRSRQLSASGCCC